MPTCFVMQPFDNGGAFDKRYDSIFAPAIKAAGLEPYRVDKDPSASIPIEEIERGIREADICLAEITHDNPNVWFELGYAIACRKEVVLVCSDERTSKFPFDVQHRTIIKYTTKAPQDYQKLAEELTTRIKAYLQKAEKLEAVAEVSPIAKFEGLSHHEIVCLAAIAASLEHPDDHASVWLIKNDMEKSGSTKIAATFALKSLLDKQFIKAGTYNDHDYNNEPYTGYSLLEKGWAWVLANTDRFVMRSKDSPPGAFDDNIPF